MKRPILVTGSHRSGTTWVGRMLCLSGEAGYLHEPFNPNRSPGWFPRPLPYWFMHICRENETAYRADVERILNFRYPFASSLVRSGPKDIARQAPELGRGLVSRLRSRRALLKDPLALFSAEWLTDSFDAQVVVMIRHPAAFVGSIKRLNWGFDYERHWLGQPLLMEHLLVGHEAEYKGYVGEVDLVGEGIVMWNSMYEVVRGYRERHPNWSFVRYEDLAEEPLDGYRALYDALGLTWSERVAREVGASASESNPKEVPLHKRRAIRRDSKAAKATWLSRLTVQEIERVRMGTAAVAESFYGDEDWAAPASS